MVSAVMNLCSADVKLSPNRARFLIIGVAIMIAAIIGTNAFVLVRMHQSDLREIQTNLL
jgi:hypothetical protein